MKRSPRHFGQLDPRSLNHWDDAEVRPKPLSLTAKNLAVVGHLDPAPRTEPRPRETRLPTRPKLILIDPRMGQTLSFKAFISEHTPLLLVPGYKKHGTWNRQCSHACSYSSLPSTTFERHVKHWLGISNTKRVHVKMWSK